MTHHIWLLLALTACSTPPPIPEQCGTELPTPHTYKQTGATCLPTCAAMVLGILGTETTPTEVARRLPMHRDGSDFFDLQNELDRRGFDSLVFTGTTAEVVATLNAGFPLVAAVNRGQIKHAVVLTGWTTDPPTAACQGTPTSLHFVDPIDGKGHDLTPTDFEERQHASQLMVVLPRSTDTAEALASSGFPLKSARATNARFRAEALLQRAARHTSPNNQAVALLKDAIETDPCWPEPYRQLFSLYRSLEQPEAAADTLRQIQTVLRDCEGA